MLGFDGGSGENMGQAKTLECVGAGLQEPGTVWEEAAADDYERILAKW